ncbi:MAG TPA: TonB-dependent receptor, partial [Gemmatimonadaceae bacterium]|nr:TonB-dependent receptor [Gemmatimonadaceae bacterium]
KISGVVTDAATGQPIEGVQVRVQGTGLGASTQGNGRYFIISVPPGTYTVVAQRIGYQRTEVANVEVRIDATRELNFRLNNAATTLTVTRIVAPPTPLVEPGITGSTQSITSEVIEALPVTSVAGVLALQQGFLEVPQNTDIVSFSDTRRNPLSPVRIRGGRGAETLTLIDGIPINNIVFGGPAFEVTTAAVNQINFQKGGFEPQYGNALSGIINVATREGGTRPAGNIEYQTSGAGGTLGLKNDELKNYDLLRGYLSGPIPGTANRVRFAVAGQTTNGRDGVYEFDQSFTDPDHLSSRTLTPEFRDLVPGWRAFGYDAERDIVGKLTFLLTQNATSKLNLTAIDYNRQRKPFDFDYLLTGFDALRAPTVNSLVDTLSFQNSSYTDVVQGSINVDRALYSGAFEQRFGRSNLTLRAARFNQKRVTCNYFQGVCLVDRFHDINYNDRFVTAGINTSEAHPATGTDEFYGGEQAHSNIFRADMQSQLTDHHNLQGGLFYQKHDIVFSEARNLGGDAVRVVPQRYAAKPYDAAAYFQDWIEYDFLTVKLGFRYDYARASGSSYSDPRDPTNGTTVRDVCEGRAPSVGASTPITWTDDRAGSPTNGVTFTGYQACITQPGAAENEQGPLLKGAIQTAQLDDFRRARPRRAFSPRIAVGFPLTEHSTLFFNAGRYSQNPTYNNLYQNTGVGTIAGPAGGNVCKPDEVKPGTNECYGTIANVAFTSGIPFLGNPNLQLEQTTSYEVGYASEINNLYAVNVVVFNKDQTGLSGIKPSKKVNDPGATYNKQPNPTYRVIVNQDFGTTRGIEFQLRRRPRQYWGFDINYSFSKSTTNSPAPDRAQQALSEGDSIQLREITSEVDQPHVFNASLIFNVRDRAPSIPLGSLLRNSYATFTTRAASGLPYTPTKNYSGLDIDDRDETNTGRGPTTFQIDMLAGKDFMAQGVKYGVFLRAVNLTDRKNCVQVFVSNGRCDQGAIDQRRFSPSSGATTTPSSTTQFDRPEYVGARRSLLGGVRVNF